MTTLRTTLFLVSGLVLAIAADAQVPRDTPAAGGARAAALDGVVREEAADARPIRRALVTVRGTAASTTERQTVTDDEGRFHLEGLSPDAYVVSVAKPGYVTAAFGARAPLAPGTPVVLVPGQTADVSVRLMRGAVIAGSARGCGGFAGNARAQAFRVTSVAGERRLLPAGPNVVIDDRGAFRLWGLPPGEYVVQAGPFTISASETRLTTAAEVTWASTLLQPSAGTVTPGVAARPEEPPPGRPVALAPCYFPGTADESAAEVIRLAPGEERTGVDFQSDFVPAAVVSGTVVGANGAPVASPRITWTRKTPLQITLPSAGIRIESEGRFVIPRIYPGQYTLVASGSATGASGAGEPAGFASMDLALNGQDLSNLVIRLQPGATVSGRVTYDGTPLPEAVPDASVRLSPAGASVAPEASQVSAPVQPDGTFELRDVPPGRYRLTATLAGAPDWTLASAMIAGVESLDSPVDIRVGQNLEDALVRFSNVRTQLSGSILDTAGRAAPGYALVAFSTDARLWQTSSRRVHLRKAATDGTFSFELPPGEYYLAAAAELTPEQAADTAILEALAGAGIRITLSAGERKTQNLRVGQ